MEPRQDPPRQSANLQPTKLDKMRGTAMQFTLVSVTLIVLSCYAMVAPLNALLPPAEMHDVLPAATVLTYADSMRDWSFINDQQSAPCTDTTGRGRVDAPVMAINGAATTFDSELSGATVPAQAPDSVPRAVWDSVVAPPNVIAGAPSLRGKWVRDALYVMFEPTATLADRRAAIALVKGTVIGGAPIGGVEKFYVVRIPYSIAEGDSASGPVLRAECSLKDLRTVHAVVPINVDRNIQLY
jgi:hypothetical protein